MGWIDDLLGYKDIRNGGPTYPRRSEVDFQGDVTVADDASAEKTVVTIGSGVVTQVKAACRVATTANLASLAGELTIDGVGTSAGDRVLVKDQTDQTQNGIHIVAAGAWSRATDFDSDADFGTGCLIPVSEGTVSENSWYMLESNAPLTLGSSNLVFGLFNGRDATRLQGVDLQSATVGSPSTGFVVAYNGTLYVAKQITDTEVSASAAIAASKLAAGSAGQVLKTVGSTPTWQSLSIGDIGEIVITPSALTANVNDYGPTGFDTATFVRLATDAGGTRAISGMDASSLTVKRKTIMNVGSSDDVTLEGEDTNSSAANRFSLPSGFESVDLDTMESAVVLYDDVQSRWVLVSTTGTLVPSGG